MNIFIINIQYINVEVADCKGWKGGIFPVNFNF